MAPAPYFTLFINIQAWMLEHLYSLVKSESLGSSLNLYMSGDGFMVISLSFTFLVFVVVKIGLYTLTVLGVQFTSIKHTHICLQKILSSQRKTLNENHVLSSSQH